MMKIEIPQIYKEYKNLYSSVNWISLLIRHSERYEISSDEDTGYNIGLTPKGKILAQYIGQNFFEGEKLNIYTSPIKRCVETAKYIIAGTKSCGKIETAHALGEPGPYVKEAKKCQKIFMKYGTRNVVKRFIDGETFGCMETLEEGSKKLMDYILKSMNERYISIFVSHDAIILPFFVYFTKYRLINEWLSYLDGGIIYSMNDEINIYFKGKTTKRVML